MPRKRDGPAPQETTPGQGQRRTRAPSVPHLKSLRNTPARETSSSQHPRVRRRQEQSWRGFAVRLYLKPGSDAHALYALLKLAAQRYGLEVGDVTEISEPPQQSDV